jgi:hypothetical protein
MSITLNTVDTIRTEQALRHIVPSYPKMLDKRIQSSLDHFSLEFGQNCFYCNKLSRRCNASITCSFSVKGR